jgi:hypothetical protein
MSSDNSGAGRHGLPDQVMQHIDNYVDSLAPQIQPRIASELDAFQQKTIDSLETHVIDAFRSLFDKDGDRGKGRSRGLGDAPPDAYGGQSLAFADEIAKFTRSFGVIADKASDDLSEIFAITEGRQGAPRSVEREGRGGFLSAAIDAVQSHLEDKNILPGGFELDGFLGTLTNTIKDVARNPEDTARAISPEIKDKVGAKLRAQHAPIAEKFTRIALDHMKRWLRETTSVRDLGDGVKEEIEGHVKDLVKGLGGLFGGDKDKSNEGSSRALSRTNNDDNEDQGTGSGFSRVISDKLSTGLTKVHRAVRLEFRTILGVIEKQLFELLPDQIQGPLEKILGGNPFDPELNREAQQHLRSGRGLGDDLKEQVLNKIRGVVRGVQETLRESILGAVNGGHRKFERASWMFVQDMVEAKVQRYLPDVSITVPDDIGNEGVKVGGGTEKLRD